MNPFHRRFSTALLCILGAALPLVPAFAAPSITVYVVDGLTRARPADTPGPAREARVKAARNEYEPFQVIVHAGSEGLQGVNVAVSDLRGPHGQAIPRRHLTLYREHSLNVTKPSPRSKEGAGLYPDALIPFLNPIDGKPLNGGRFSAAPFDVTANTNQPVWVDLFVPKATPPGRYSGTLKVTAQHAKAVTVPVQLTVWNFTLPDTPSMRSNFGGFGPRIAAAHKVTVDSPQFRAVERRYAEAMAAHRICPPIPNYLRPKVNPDGSIDPSETHAALKQWVEQFHVTGFPLSFPGRDPLGSDRERSVKYLQSMYAYLKQNGWAKYAYIYVLDEPNTAEAYEQVRQRAKLIHDAQPGIKVLCTEQPTPQDPAWGTLVGSVDIWVPLWPLLEEKAGAERLAAGEELWSYTALCQGKQETPFWELDFPLLNFRIPMWMSWHSGMTGLLYWTTVNWGRAGDVWTNPLTYNQFNGEGSLFYPGTDAGFAGPVASIRLKQIREGLEDYEYIRLLAARDKKLADAMVARLARSWFDWDTNPAHLSAVRDLIGDRLSAAAAALNRSASGAPGASPAAPVPERTD